MMFKSDLPDISLSRLKALVMAKLRKVYLALVVALIFFVSVSGLASYVNSDFGNLNVRKVSIPNGNGRLSGLLYVPKATCSTQVFPAVVLAHGISSAKESMCDLALELARRGIVALAVDLIGHHGSDGQMKDGESDPTFGVSAAVHYAKLQPWINRSAIGLVGHSLGAGAIRAAAFADNTISASVFIGGGVGEMTSGEEYSVLNSTFPRNLLIAIGAYDVLFNVTQLKTEVLPQVFNSSQEVASDIVYGSFSSRTARKLIVPLTTHLFEPVDPFVVRETADWMSQALKDQGSTSPLTETGFVYPFRELTIVLSLAGFVCLVFPFSLILLGLLPSGPAKAAKTKYGVLEDWKAWAVWGIIGVVLFFPLSFAGFLIPFPPLLFGSSLAWWMLGAGCVGILAIVFLARFSSFKVVLRKALKESFTVPNLAVALWTFALLYVVAYVAERFFPVGPGLFVPVFSALSLTRFLVFFAFLPFLAVYFFAEGLFLHESHDWATHRGARFAGLVALGKVLLIKVSPYVFVLCFQYVPMALFGIRLLPGFSGFLVEFLWLIIPLFVVSTSCSWWFYRKTSTIGTGTIFNSLIFAWIAATTFPF